MMQQFYVTHLVFTHLQSFFGSCCHVRGLAFGRPSLANHHVCRLKGVFDRAIPFLFVLPDAEGHTNTMRAMKHGSVVGVNHRIVVVHAGRGVNDRIIMRPSSLPPSLNLDEPTLFPFCAVRR